MTRRLGRAGSRPGWRVILGIWLGGWLSCACVGLGADSPTNPANGLVINEVLAVNAKGLKDPQGQYENWIEIYNPSDRYINLAGFFLTDDLSEPTKWRFPTGIAARTTIPSNRFLLIWADGDTSASGLHAGFSFDAEGEEVGLFDPNGLLIDAIVFGPQTEDISFGRIPDGGMDLRYLGFPTPGAKNDTAYPVAVEDPLFSRFRGFYDAQFQLTIACPTPGATIRYTTDGTDPQVSKTTKVYTAPLSIDKTTCLRAVALIDGWKPSRIITHTYVLGASAAIKSLPLISLVADAGQTFYEPNGVAAIVGGTYNGGVWQSTGAGSYNNILNRDLERPVSFEWLQPADNGDLQVDCGLRVHGSEYMRPRYTRGSKFSWRLYFRSDYGPGKLEYPLFPFEVQRFDEIVLRAGHNDMSNPFIKDELVRRLLKDMGHVSSGGTLANLFINGQYKGYYNPCEHIDEPFCQAWFDSNQSWDVITMFGGVRDGDAVRWNALINFVRQNNLVDTASYNQVLSQLDIEQFVDYLILRLWSGDWDWPQNNWAAASERSDQGRWRFFVWDAEGSFFSDRLQTVYFSSLNSQNNEHGYLYRALKANPRFRQLFGDRVYKHFYNGGALTSQNITRRFNELRTQMAGVLPKMDMYVVNTWVPQRPAIFFNVCVQEGVYSLTGPILSINGKPQYGGYAQPGDTLTLATTEPDAAIYYSLDGVDPGPRLGAGSIGLNKLVTRGSTKRWLVPTGPVDNAWRGQPSFDDSGWRTGFGEPGGIGFGRDGDLPENLSFNILAAMNKVNASCLVRIPFECPVSSEGVSSLILRVQYDAGFVAYINGSEVARRSFTGDPSWNSQADIEGTDSTAVSFRLISVTSSKEALRQGQNVLAIHGMNSSATDKDFLINAELTANVVALPLIPDADRYTDPFPLDRSVTVKARVVKGSTIGALSEALFSVGPVAQSLRISEILYHPLDTGDPNDPNAEYIELTHIGSRMINLNGVQLTDGVEFVFPAVDLEPGQYIVVAKDPAVFQARYGNGIRRVGPFSGSLSNGGEWIELQDAIGVVIQRFKYADDWYPLTDGLGYSLTAVDPGADPNTLSEKDRWRPSAAMGGSPGWDDWADVSGSVDQQQGVSP